MRFLLVVVRNLAIIQTHKRIIYKEKLMFGTRILYLAAFAFAFSLGLTTAGHAQGDKKKVEKKKQEVWTDVKDPTLPIDFKFQGEYVTKLKGGAFLGCQVIALGNGSFQAGVCKGGLPGAGWDGKSKSLLDGKLEGDKVVFAPAMGKRKYLAQSPLEFSATSKFPPAGHLEYTGILAGDTLVVALREGDKEFPIDLKKQIRTSPTLGGKAPDGAIVLFDGSNKDEWKGGRVDKSTNLLNTDGSDITTKRKFSNYTVHVEFMLPFRPEARGQGRGNSGFYQVDHYEVQILDSFGLEGKNNECGGVYSQIEPKLNMCLPPLQWQTYDVEFTNAVREGDKVVKKSRLTCRLNGVVIHDDVELKGVTGGARSEPEGTPGVLRPQGHGNPLQFRNIWIIEKK
jgi:3-keto-disaccharide hydrolase